jgi:hypothetical protein
VYASVFPCILKVLTLCAYFYRNLTFDRFTFLCGTFKDREFQQTLFLFNRVLILQVCTSVYGPVGISSGRTAALGLLCYSGLLLLLLLLLLIYYNFSKKLLRKYRACSFVVYNLRVSHRGHVCNCSLANTISNRVQECLWSLSIPHVT